MFRKAKAIDLGYLKSGSAARRTLHLLIATIGVSVAISAYAESANDISPPTDYRQWFHVNAMVVDKSSSLFEALGGMHIIHVNSIGEAALKNGGPYPNGTIFLDDLHDFSVADGTYVEGALKGLPMMVKDSGKYASTGGWGFQYFVKGDPQKPFVTDPTGQCFNCHQPKKDEDYVYSSYIP